MAKFIIDSKFGETIKSARIQHNISAQDLANYIKKSPSYVTRLEHGDIKSINTETFDSMISFIFGEDTDRKSIEESIYESLRLKYTDQEIERITWFYNFSTVSCMIPIPPKLVDNLNNTITKNNIDISYLLNRINSNEELSPNQLNDPSTEDNRWYIDKEDNKAKWIRIKIDRSLLLAILNKKIGKAPYIYLLSIVYYMNKIINFKEITQITNKERSKIMDDSVSMLNDFKFYNSIEKNRIYTNQHTIETNNQLYNSFDTDNQLLIKDILSFFRLVSDYDITITNQYLTEFVKTAEWDPGFTIKLLSFKYSKLNQINVHKRKEFLEAINKLIEQYSNTSNNIDKIEKY